MSLSELELKRLIEGGETNRVELKVASPRPTEMAEWSSAQSPYF